MIYIRGDTHGELSAITFLRSRLTAEDKLIVTGDFGFVFRGERKNMAERNNLNTLAEMPFEILFVDGNHENFPELEAYPEVIRYGAPVRQIRPNIFWLRRGYIYTIEGNTITLKADFLNTLKGGEKAITILFADGAAEGTFTVSHKSPATGDSFNAMLWICLMGMTAMAGAALCVKKQKA